MAALEIGVLILAGGQATRLPNKLELDAGALPMLARVYGNVSRGRETFISCKATFPAELDARLTCPMVVDRWPLRGPLAGILSTLAQMRSRFVFVVAGDAPFITTAFIDRLAAHVRPGDEAVVPRHARGIEPLAAIYDRSAFLRAGTPLLFSGQGALRLVLDALAAKYIDVQAEEHEFANINTPADYAAVHEVLA